MRKNKIVIMFSRLFPTTHSRRGEPTRFIEKVMLGDKIHTIRRQYDRWKYLAEKTNEKRYEISLCQWAATPRRSQHKQIALLKSQIGVQHISMEYDPETDKIMAIVDGTKNIDPAIIAENEGLTLPEFKEWFFGKNQKDYSVYKGAIIHMTDFRY